VAASPCSPSSASQLSATAHVNSIKVDVVTGRRTNRPAYSLTCLCRCILYIYIQQETSGRTAVHLLFSHGGIAHTFSGSPHVYNSAARFIRTSVVCQGHDLVELREPVSISVHDLTTRQSRCDGITHLPSIIYCSQVVGVLDEKLPTLFDLKVRTCKEVHRHN